MSLRNMLYISVKDPTETLIALQMFGRKRYEHMRVKNDSHEVLQVNENRSRLKSPAIYVSI